MAMVREKMADALGRVFGDPQWREGERSEPERSVGVPKTAASQDGVESGARSDPEVLEKPQRRRFSAAYKARIVQEAEACTECGQVGALLRREGLYSSYLSKWRRQYREGGRGALGDDKRGRKRRRNPLEAENEKLRKKTARLERALAQANTIIEFQKKFAEVLGIPLSSAEEQEGEN